MLLDRMAGGPEFAPVLLDAIEAGNIPVSAFTSGQREQLRKSKNPALKSRAEKLFAVPGGNRESAFAEAKAAFNYARLPWIEGR